MVVELKIYIAGCFEERLRLRKEAEKLWHQGHEIVSTWLDEVAKPEFMTDAEFFKKLGVKDLCEIASADLLINDTIVTSPRGGAANEFGFALGSHQKKLVWVVGPLRTPFHQLADRHFEGWEEAVVHLSTFGTKGNIVKQEISPLQGLGSDLAKALASEYPLTPWQKTKAIREIA